MSTVPLLSVVIPCYNRPDYLRECLQSVVDRAAPDWEVVVVDDGSTENIRVVVDAFAPIVRYVAQPNAGRGPARNAGIQASKGRYIKFLDDDDLLFSADVLMQQVELLERHPQVGLVHAQALKFDEHGNHRGVHQPTWANASYIHSGDDEIERLLIQNHILLSSVLVRRQVFADGTRFQTYPTAQDWECWIQIARRWSVAYVAEPLVAYRVHENSISARKTEELVVQVHEGVVNELFTDDAFAQRYQHLIGPVYAHLDVLAASVAHRGRRPRSCMRYASRGMLRSVKCGRWKDAKRSSKYLLKSLIPLRMRDYVPYEWNR